MPYSNTHLDVIMPVKIKPPQPPTPFKLYSAHHAPLAVSLTEFKALDDEERLKWIDLALEQETSYQVNNPQFTLCFLCLIYIFFSEQI